MTTIKLKARNNHLLATLQQPDAHPGFDCESKIHTYEILDAPPEADPSLIMRLFNQTHIYARHRYSFQFEELGPGKMIR